jgi:hypothetical protein
MNTNLEKSAGRRVSRLRIALWSAAALMLLVPLLAMQVTDDVNWTAADFVVAGVIILGAGIPFELAVRKTGNAAYRAGVGVALAAGLLLVWVNGAVGIIGSEDNDANLMYFGVLAVGIIGAIIARLQPGGMARVLSATALAQALVAVVALVAGLGATEPPGPLGILILNGFFVALFGGSASLFRRAAQAERI